VYALSANAQLHLWTLHSCLTESVHTLLAGNDMEESGWKMVSGDVFRPPKNAVLLCVQIGSGVQIITSAFATLFFAALGKSLSTLFISTAACCLLVFCIITLYNVAAHTICTSLSRLVSALLSQC